MDYGMEIGLRPGHIVLDGDTAPPYGKGHSTPPLFWPMSIVAKQSPIPATAELLFTIIFSMYRLHTSLKNKEHHIKKQLVMPVEHSTAGIHAQKIAFHADYAVSTTQGIIFNHKHISVLVRVACM